MATVSADAFLLPVGSGFRFCVLRLPANKTEVRGSVLVAAPFAEELNKSRHMIALAAERMAANGYAVLHLDTLGSGDSSGDFGDATWDEWISDVERGYALLQSRFDAPIWIWGVRAGALLATALAERIADPPNLCFWQPVAFGQQHLKQFLRLRLANEFLGEGGNRSGTEALSKRLAAGETLEIAGYTLTPELAAGLAAAELGVRPRFTGRIVCLEVGAQGNDGLTPALQGCVKAWREAGARVVAESVSGPPFWQTQQITEAPELIDVTISHLLESKQ